MVVALAVVAGLTPAAAVVTVLSRATPTPRAMSAEALAAQSRPAPARAPALKPRVTPRTTRPALPARKAPVPRRRPHPHAKKHLPTLPNWGIDISYPQCRHMPKSNARLVVVGINGGRPGTANPCLRREIRLARSHAQVWTYLNVAAPRHGGSRAYATHLARVALRTLARVGAPKDMIWLDVETANHWARNRRTNRRVISTLIHELHRHHARVGVYSVPQMWHSITGSMRLDVPVWIATVSRAAVPHACRTGFGGHPALLAQYVGRILGHEVDIDLSCPRR